MDQSLSSREIYGGDVGWAPELGHRLGKAEGQGGKGLGADGDLIRCNCSNNNKHQLGSPSPLPGRETLIRLPRVTRHRTL